VGYAVAVAAGEPGIVARTAVGTGLANILLTACLAPVFGPWGVLAGTVVALTGGAIAQVIVVQRRFELRGRDYVDAVIPALRAYVSLALPVLVFCYANPVHGRAAQAITLVIVCALYILACAAWALRAGRLPQAIASRLPTVGWLRAPA
jgi:O-antigen/teichoic acid export membrane protein